MSALTLDRQSIYDRVKLEMARAKVPITITRDEVEFIADVILEEMKRQYLADTGQVT